ncbi:pilus assembly protein [Pseudomonas sp. CCM 7891]|uniref:Pilus assembly protein n=1 Tax=Pseudomonas karstica TaxID=1055468 RepID=A0A7X2RUP8_9PSED|nr:TadE/TadG family type IV pilus assembly protein [Pseudomonas karstica]MTD21376.1 pilus assembly protein [Pseudomonas karstica]
MKTNLPRRQKGAAAIEFAVVFVVFFAVFYGMISYSLPLLLLQGFNQATAEGVRRGVAVDPNIPDYSKVLQDTAKDAARLNLNWIPSAFHFADDHVTASYVGGVLTVQVSYPSTLLKGVLPFMVLPGIGTVPNLPADLQARSSLQF